MTPISFTNPYVRATRLQPGERSTLMQQITRTVFTAIILGSVFLVPVAGLSLSHAATVHARHSATLLPVSTPTRAWAEELNAKASFKYPQSAFFRDWIGN